MNLRFFLAEMKRQALSSIFWFVSLGVLLTVTLYNFSSLSAVSMEMLLGFDITSIFSDEIFGNLKLDFLPDLTEYVEYFAFFAQLVTVAVCFYAASLGANALSRDIGEGTIEFLCSQPASKLSILLTKLFSRIAALFLFDFALFLLSAILSSIAAPNGEPYMGSVFSVFFHSFLTHLIFLMIGFCVSSFWSSAAPSSSFCLALVFFSVLVGVLAPITRETAWLRGLSPFHYSVPSEVIRPGYAFPLVGWAMLLIGGAVFFGLAYLRFYKRDLV